LVAVARGCSRPCRRCRGGSLCALQNPAAPGGTHKIVGPASYAFSEILEMILARSAAPARGTSEHGRLAKTHRKPLAQRAGSRRPDSDLRLHLAMAGTASRTNEELSPDGHFAQLRGHWAYSDVINQDLLAFVRSSARGGCATVRGEEAGSGRGGRPPAGRRPRKAAACP
jgi:hypothetical protein